VIKHIPINRFTFDALARNKDLRLEIQNHCNSPEKNVVINLDGDCFVCPCDAWLPVSVGKIESFESLEQVWNNPIAQEIQADIADKKFSLCAVEMCGVTNKNLIFTNYTVSINIDESCNLKCPTCRKAAVMLTQGEMFDTKLQRVRHIVQLLEKFDKPCHIVMSGNGDPLASNVMRPIIHELEPKSNRTFRLFTNGLLLKKQLERSKILPQITEYQISIDAGSREVYEKIRLGGRWDSLIENFDFLADIAKQKNAKVWLMFVLQKDNWHDLDNFAELCQRYNWTGNVTKMVNWNTDNNFEEQDVIGNTAHPLHQQAMNKLKEFSHKYVAEHKMYLDASLLKAVT
jgi:MoaA/NifB/PqqE/SkfB family radical SAM enzyme